MLEILKYPNPQLRRKAEPIEQVDDEIRQLIDDMIDTMYDDDGVGLAATQVGVIKQLIVLDVGEGPVAYLNPEIIGTGEETAPMEEGCLSVPGVRIDITRPTEITVKVMDVDNQAKTIEASGMLARVLQHEIDHLNGLLIIDHASSIQRTMIKSRLRKLG